ncbi:hypothetical protein ELQ21_05455, partial [Neisseria meningitidis]|nr:hypothetical protein [Neisseria meningitidis]MBG8649678.1 hypothetical protein [Neisseria meningitidis]MBG8654470.1 hypothetical protein [Neisseria meningitidis]MBG8809563.1 hypothetical protein [Neisseria meningitidis]
MGFRRHPPSPSFPRKRESRPWDSGNIQRLAEALEILDSRFHGNDERLRESKPLGNSNIQRFLDSDFKCNTSVLVVGTDSRIKHLAFRSQVFFLV